MFRLLFAEKLNIMENLTKSISCCFSKKQKICAFIFYLLFFALLFLQLPLKKQISGNCDTWLALTYSTHSLEVVKSFFTGEKIGKAMFPTEDPLAYGESAPGMQILIAFFKFFGFSDYWTNYFFIILLLTLTAFGIFIFASNFTDFFPASLFAGFCFTCSNMVFAHIDDSVIIFFFIPALALHFIYLFFKSKNIKYLIISSILAGIEVYFSFYVFFYQFLMIFVLFIYLSRKNGYGFWQTAKFLIPYPMLSFIVAAPDFFYYLNTLYRLDFVPVFEAFFTAKMASFSIVDMFLVLPDNLIYPNIGSFLKIPMNWGFVRHYNFISLLALGLFVYSLFKWNKNRVLFISLAVVSVFFASGPVFMFNMKEVFFSPLYIFYKPIPILKFLRVAVRAYFIFLFAVSVSAAISIERICRKYKHGEILAAGLFLIQFVENTPFPIKGFDASYTEKVPVIYENIKETGEKNPLILELPSTMNIKFYNIDNEKFKNPENFVIKNKKNPVLRTNNMGVFVDSWDDLFEYNREIIYTNWQNSHKIDSINGVNGYFPTSRIILQNSINNLPSPEAFNFLRDFGVDFVVWHDFMRVKADRITLEDLEKSPCLKKITETAEGSTLFKLSKCKNQKKNKKINSSIF